MIDILRDLLKGLAAIGHTEEGWNRVGFSPADCEARSWFAGRMREAGLAVRTDAFGNIFGRLEGWGTTLPAIATGSHLDTVPNGGNYDGVLGCAAGLAAICEIAKSGGTRHPLELIIFQIEESSRFACSTMGSKILCGTAMPEVLGALVDRNGISLPRAMEMAGLVFDSSLVVGCKLQFDAYKAFIELHMDQGSHLEDSGVPLGVVTGIVGVRRARIYYRGKALHAGATPMRGRKNALLPAARSILELDRIGNSMAGYGGTVATTGNVVVEPGAINVIPATVMLHCEMRSGEAEILERAWAEFDAFVMDVSREYGISVEIVITDSIAPIPMDDKVQNLLRQQCEANGAPYINMFSGAGHDCMNIASKIPSGMLFVRSVGGISHHPSEAVRDDDAALGCKILKDALLELGK